MRPYIPQHFRASGLVRIDKSVIDYYNLFELTSIIVFQCHLTFVFYKASVVKWFSIGTV